jgi:histone deacetylase 11
MMRPISRWLWLLFFPSSLGVGEEAPPKVPIIYTEQYNISFFGLEKLHPFDGAKYGKVYRYLLQKLGFQPQQFYTPSKVSDKDLRTVHTDAYLESLTSSSAIARIAEFPSMAVVPNYLLQRILLDPMRYGTGGTILGIELAIEHGWAINLCGGYHHAKADSGGGFCFFADIPIAVYRLHEKHRDLKVLIVDLDAHQGNGLESIFKNDPRIDIFDVYNMEIYPGDWASARFIDYPFPVKSMITDQAYLELLRNELGKAIHQTKPGMIIYNAGSDIYEKDPLGAMSISDVGIIQRDEIVFRFAIENKIPILMVLSGGYTSRSALIIGRSIENILTGLFKFRSTGKKTDPQ